jgi:hypothetical protein
MLAPIYPSRMIRHQAGILRNPTPVSFKKTELADFFRKPLGVIKKWSIYLSDRGRLSLMLN